MASVTFLASVGGDGSTVTDDSNPSTGLAAGGHRTRFVPALAQVVAVASFVVTTAQGVANAYFTPVRAASAPGVNINLAAPGTTIDGVTMAVTTPRQRFLAKSQTTGSENGIYDYNGSATPATRSSDADASAEWVPGKSVAVQESGGSPSQADTVWLVTNDGAISLGTTALAFSRFPSLGLPNTWTALQTFNAALAVPRDDNNNYQAGSLSRFLENSNAIGSLAAGSNIQTHNAYYSSGWKKIASGYATAWGVFDGTYYLYVSNAGAGNANDAITWQLAYSVLPTGPVLADLAPAGAFDVGFRGSPVVTLDANGDMLATYAGKTIRHTDGTARAWTIQPFATIPHPVGTSFRVRNFGTGVVTLTRGTGVALRSSGSSTDENKALAQYADGILTQEAQDVWLYSGAL